MSAINSTSEPAEPVQTVSWWQRYAQRVSFAIRVSLIFFVLAGATWWFLLSPAPVTTHTVATGTVTAEVMGTGTLEARISTIVGPKISGLIVSIAVDQGDRVTTGALLFQLEDSAISQQVRMAESEVDAATAALDRIRADQRRAEAVLTQARLSHERMAELASNNVASLEDVDKAFELLAIAEAGLSVAKAANVEGQKRIAFTSRSLEYQEARLQDTTIEAPYDALVVRRDREVGEVVTAGTSVLQLVSTDEMWATLWVDETELARLAEAQPARVVFRSEPDVAYAGVLVRIGREADRETREIVVDVRVDRLPVNWAVGQRAEAYIQVARRDAVTVLPSALLQVRDSRTGVMLDEEGKATWREITVDLRGRENVEITSGLSPGDVVVSRAGGNSELLREGQRISSK